MHSLGEKGEGKYADTQVRTMSCWCIGCSLCPWKLAGLQPCIYMCSPEAYAFCLPMACGLSAVAAVLLYTTVGWQCTHV